MPEGLELNHPWLVAVWPGMGNVAISAGYYLMAKLGMYGLAEFEANDLFDTEHVVVKGGLIKPAYRPRNRFFLWVDPNQKHDLVLFIGEAQPPLGKYPFCRKLIEYAKELEVERVFTFAAMGTEMNLDQPSRVVAAATDEAQLEGLKALDLQILEEGYIGGLNGVLLGVAAESGLPGTCLLGEMPGLFRQMPFPRASQNVLEVFKTIFQLELDTGELAEEAQHMEEQLNEVMSQMQDRLGEQFGEMEEEFQPEQKEEERLSPEDEELIENLFQQSQNDRSKAYELKRHLDRLNVFKDYEDRFLDLFK